MEPHSCVRPPLFPFQAEAIRRLRKRTGHLALSAPTGSGKGRILEEIAANPEERILLLTPLIALGRQQSRRFRELGIPVRENLGKARHPVKNPGCLPRVWITSPEATLYASLREKIKEWKPTLLAVDEAHCFEEWGEAFRPAYRSIPELVRTLGVKRTLWMSATLPKSTIEILESSLPGDWALHGSFSLPPGLEVTEFPVRYGERVEHVRRSIHEKVSPGLVFAGTRKNAENYGILLRSDGKSILTYHAGLSDEERRNIENRLELDSPTRSSIVATNAFGMGMDYGYLEWVILAHTPFSLLGLMQSLGRVARGKRTGSAEIYWAEDDFRIAGYLLRNAKPDSRQANDLRLLRNYLEGTPSDKVALLRDTFV